MRLVIHLNEHNFESEVLLSPIPVLVDFYADWCGPCRQMAPVLEALVDDMAGTMKVGKVNTDENKGLAAAYRIEALPTMIVFNAGEPLRRLVGVKAKRDLLEAVSVVVD